MRLLFFKSNSFMQEDFQEVLLHSGYLVDPVTYVFTDPLKDEFFAKKFKKRLQKIQYAAVISISFFPVISDICNEFEIPYISWCYDSPIPYFERFDMPNNHIWHFDKLETAKYQEKGFEQIKYLPLAVNISRLDRQLAPLEQMPDYMHDIAFVGKIYRDKFLKARKVISSERFQGIIEGYAAVQTQFFGVDILEKLLVQSPYTTQLKEKEDFPWETFVNLIQGQVTYQERDHILKKLAEVFSVDCYTVDEMEPQVGLRIHPGVNYYTKMPEIFRKTKINLNINYRAIRSGLSARILDIMGAGGFLMTTPQPELFDYFEMDRDFVAFSSLQELIEKCDYYLKHDEERHQIAKNGYEKVKAFHTYEHRLPILLSSL